MSFPATHHGGSTNQNLSPKPPEAEMDILILAIILALVAGLFGLIGLISKPEEK